MRIPNICLAWFAAALATDAVTLDPSIVLEHRGKGGILVRLGADTGHMIDLHRKGQFVIQALERDRERVAKAREHLQSEGVYGPVSVRVLQEDRLPYADNLINLIVADDLMGVSESEILRVLIPLGAAWIRKGDEWKKLVKAWPDGMDDWTHFLHGANGNAVSSDEKVGPPRRLQWKAGALWGRSHEMNNSVAALVTGQSRMFLIFDKGITGLEDQRLPEKWTLMARDAFNGSLLWERPLKNWGSHVWRTRALRFFGGTMARRLVVDGDRLYCTFEYGGKVDILDATTGETLGTIAGTEGAEEILADGDQVICASRLQLERNKFAALLTSYNSKTEQVEWQKKDAWLSSQSLSAGPNEVLYHNRKELVCLNRKDGSQRWRIADKKSSKTGRRRNARMLIVVDGKAVLSSRQQIRALDLKDGRIVWEAPGPKGSSMREFDLFYAQGNIWCSGNSGTVKAYDVKTGKVAKVLDASGVQSHGHHLRCYRAKATENYLITQYRGVEFLSLSDEPHNQNDWLRGTCTYGIMPANGLLYAPPHSCFCYSSALNKGLSAFAGETRQDLQGLSERSKPGPVEKGPAYGFNTDQKTDAKDWPLYRHDSRRTGATPNAVPATLKRNWKASLGTELTPAVVADGRLYVAAKNKHTLFALDARNGKTLWSFVADARIDSPPTLHRGLLVFGGADGFLYCLRAEDGKLSWRRRLAPAERWLALSGQLESAWRLHGSVAVIGGLAYCSAGRSSFIDGGIRMFAVEIATGEIRHRAVLNTIADTRVDRERNEFVASYHIEGANSDILVAEGGYIYLNQMKFTPDLKLQLSPYLGKAEVTKRPSINLDNKEYVNEDIFKVKWRNKTYATYDQLAGILVDENQNVGERDVGLHLFTTSGFLDASFFSRTYWMYSKTWTGFNIANLAPKAGQLLSIGPKNTYALKAYTARTALSPIYKPGSKGYQLVADDNENEPTLDPRAWGKDKGMGFSRGAPPVWNQWLPVRVRAMVLAGKTLFVCGPPDTVPEKDPAGAFRGRMGSELRAVSAIDGRTLSQHQLSETPIFDGMIAAEDRLYICTRQGDIICMGAR